MTSLLARVRITTKHRAVWRTCAGCTALAPLAPDQTRCPECQPPAQPVRRPLAA